MTTSSPNELFPSCQVCCLPVRRVSAGALFSNYQRAALTRCQRSVFPATRGFGCPRRALGFRKPRDSFQTGCGSLSLPVAVSLPGARHYCSVTGDGRWGDFETNDGVFTTMISKSPPTNGQVIGLPVKPHPVDRSSLCAGVYFDNKGNRCLTFQASGIVGIPKCDVLLGSLCRGALGITELQLMALQDINDGMVNRPELRKALERDAKAILPSLEFIGDYVTA